MKSLIFSMCALILLVGIIIYNGIYIKNVTSDLIEKAENITYENKKSTEEFRKLWEENEHKICISVSHKDIDNINLALSVLEAKQKSGESDSFNEYSALLREYINEIKNKERLHIDNVV